jgi:hypothetical protein
MDLVNRYLAEAHGPPPRSPLRFWIGGEWVEVASPETEPLPQFSGGPEVRPMEPVPLSAELAQAANPPAAPAEAVARPGAVRERRLPIYDWIGSEGREDRGIPPTPTIRERPAAAHPGTRPSTPLTRSARPGSRHATDEQATGMRLVARRDAAAQMASKLRDFGQRDDHNLVRGKIARLREQRDAGELSETAFATRVAELINGAMAPRVAAEGNPSST